MYALMLYCMFYQQKQNEEMIIFANFSLSKKDWSFVSKLINRYPSSGKNFLSITILQSYIFTDVAIVITFNEEN